MPGRCYLRFCLSLRWWRERRFSSCWHFLRLVRGVVAALGVPGCADGGDDLLAEGGGLHGLPAGCAVEQPLAEFAFETADLGARRCLRTQNPRRDRPAPAGRGPARRRLDSRPRPRPPGPVAFLFAGPHITHIYLHLIRPGPREVDAWQLAAQPAAAHLLHPLQAQRLQARSTTTGNTIYLEQPAPTGRLPRGRWRAPATTHATSEQTRQMW